jgi:hypothetical protein
MEDRVSRGAEGGGRHTQAWANIESWMYGADSTKANRRCRSMEGRTMVHGVVYIRFLYSSRDYMTITDLVIRYFVIKGQISCSVNNVPYTCVE